MSKPIVRLVAETNDYEKKIRQAQKTFQDFMKGIGMSTSKLTALSFGIAGTTAALKAAKDAFFKNEQNLDEWGRTVESAKSIYAGFLNSLNTGDISGFLSNISRITQAARDAYDALDELNTFNAFNKVNIAKARSGLTGAIADFREGKGSKESVQAASQALITELTQRQKLQQEAYVKAVANVAAQRGVSDKDLLKVMTGSYGSFAELKDVKMTGRETGFYGGGMFGGGGTYEKIVPKNERERLARAVQQLNDTEIDTLQSMAEAAQMTEVEINNQRKSVARILNGRGNGTSGNNTGTRASGMRNDYIPAAGSIDEQAAKVQTLQKAWRAAADDDSREKYRRQIEQAEFALDILMGKTSGLPAMNYGIGSLAGSRGGGISGVPGIATNKGEWKLDEKAMRGLSDQIAKANMKTTASLTKEVGSIAGGISGIFGGIESLGVELPEGLKNVLGGIEGVMTILSSIAAIVTAIEALTAADTIIPFARGGVVRSAGGTVIPGNFPSGDNLRIPVRGGGMAAVNSGELILNTAQQNAIASQLGGAASLGDYVLVSEIAGEDIRIALTRNSVRRRRGEYVTTKRN